jgi:hypothetical protein
VGLGDLLIEGLVGDSGPKEGIEAAVKIRNRLDPLAGTGRRQRQAQANRAIQFSDRGCKSGLK